MSTTETSAGPAPEILGGIVPYLMLDGAVKAAELYARAFDAKEVARQPVDDKGRTMHIHLHLHGASLMLSDAYPEHGAPLKSPQGFMLHIQDEAVDAIWKRAVDAGMEVVIPLDVMFWGDRYGQLRDPFGVMWTIGGPAPAA